MGMADTSRARSSLGFAERFVNGVAGDLRTMNLTEEQRFTLLWDLAYQVYHSLEEHRIPDEDHARHYDATICDDVVTDRNKPYKGSDSVPF